MKSTLNTCTVHRCSGNLLYTANYLHRDSWWQSSWIRHNRNKHLSSTGLHVYHFHVWDSVELLFQFSLKFSLIHINSLNQKTEIMVLKFTSCTPLLYHSYSPTSQGNGFWTCGHVQSWTCGGCVHLCCTGGHVCSQSVGRMGDIPCVPLCHKQLL